MAPDLHFDLHMAPKLNFDVPPDLNFKFICFCCGFDNNNKNSEMISPNALNQSLHKLQNLFHKSYKLGNSQCASSWIWCIQRIYQENMLN